MVRRVRKYGLKRWLANAVVVILAWNAVTVLVPTVAVTAYNMATLEDCVKGVIQAEQDYGIAREHLPPTGDVKVRAADLLPADEALTQRVADLRCPLSVADEQAAFVEANRWWETVLRGLIQTGIPEDSVVRDFIAQRVNHAGQRALATFEDLKKALAAEIELQRPKQQAAAPAQ